MRQLLGVQIPPWAHVKRTRIILFLAMACLLLVATIARPKQIAVVKQLTSNPYTGVLFDTHLHQDSMPSPDEFGTLMSDQNVEASLIFTFVSPDTASADLDDIRNLTNCLGGKLVPFADTIDESTSDLTTANADTILTEGSELLTGLGEFAFYQEPFTTEGVDPDEEPFASVYATLTSHNAWIMLHPVGTQEESLDRALSANPNQRFLLHGPHVRDFVARILAEHANTYYTLDTATFLERDDGAPLQYPPGDDFCNVTEEEFVADFNANGARYLDRAVTNWRSLVETYPDQVLWGTDVSCDAHYTQAVYGRLISFSRDFISQLAASVQEKYARTNAAALFTPVAATEAGVDCSESPGGNDDEDAAASDDSSSGGCSFLP